MTVKRDKELRVLTELCRHLAKRGVGVEVRDAIPGLTLHAKPSAGGGALAYVVINGSHISWWRVGHNHPISDVEGAAERIESFLRRPVRDGGGQGPVS
jgi:hypothetical protein